MQKLHTYYMWYRAGPPPHPHPRLPVWGGGPPQTDRGTSGRAHLPWRAHPLPLKQENRGPNFTLYCLIQTLMVILL